MQPPAAITPPAHQSLPPVTIAWICLPHAAMAAVRGLRARRAPFPPTPRRANRNRQTPFLTRNGENGRRRFLLAAVADHRFSNLSLS